MNINDLLKNLQRLGDEMEAPNGMNIVTETVEEENEIAENKSKQRVYLKAIDALSELHDLIHEGADPVEGILDDDTAEFSAKVADLMEEIYSRSLAFD